MHLKWKYWSIAIVLFISNVICDDCVIYDFEDGFTDQFSNTVVPCNGLESWEELAYSSTDILPPHDTSGTFVSPLEDLSCVSSSHFTMSVGGFIEVNVYMDSINAMDTISVLASQVVVGGNDANVGSAAYFPSDPTYKMGWRTLRFELRTTNDITFDGYITLMGIQGSGSTVLVDSFRYIGPTTDDDTCNIYDDDEITTTAPPTEPELSTTPPETGPELSTTPPDTGPESSTTPPDTGPELPTTQPDTGPELSTTDLETPSTPALSTEPDTEPFTTLDPNTEPDSTTRDPTEEPITPPSKSFWTPITIALVAVACFFLLVIVAAISFYLGWYRAKKDEPEDIDVDLESLPRTITVPRVNRVYADVNFNPYSVNP